MKLIEQETKLPINEVKLEGREDSNKFEFRRHSELLPKTNIRALFVGPSACGKTSALLSLIYHKEGITFKNIYLFSKSLYQPKYEELAAVMKTIPEIGFFTFSDTQDVPSTQTVKPYSIMIFDDVVCEAQSHMRLYFSMGRHRNVDSFYLLQTYTAAPKHLVRDNSNFILVFRQDNLNCKHIFDDHVVPDMKFDEFLAMCSFAWNSRLYGCLLINKECDINNGRYRVGFDTYIMK